MVLAVDDLNATGEMPSRVDLLFEDTAGSPTAGISAAERLIAAGVSAIAGEFHSVVADAVIDVVERAAVPFVCASATLSDITSRRLAHVFRIAPPQTYGWEVYARYLLAAGFGQVVALGESNVYWNGGAGVIERALEGSTTRFSRIAIDGPDSAPRAAQILADTVTQSTFPTIALLLVGYPEPLRSVLASVRGHGLAPPTLEFGDPAGRTIFADWWEVAGGGASAMPFLAYVRPGGSSLEGRRFEQRFAARYGRPPTFVACEGYDSVVAVARAIEIAGRDDSASVTEALRTIRFQGTRGEVAFSTSAEPVVHQQWRWPPTVVASYIGARSPETPFTIMWDPESGNAPRRQA